MNIQRVLVFCGALALTSGVASAQQAPQVQRVPIQPTTISVSDGKGMFEAYCTACHGPSGKGDGPAAKALKTVPADLTRISVRNKGTFPDVKISRWITGADEIAAHGSRDMPTWGKLFQSMGTQPAGFAGEADMRVNALVTYLQSIQQK